MEILEEFLGNVSWEEILTTCLRIVVVLLIAWIAMKVLRIFVGKLERNLLQQSAVEGEPPSESQKRVETLTRLVKQGLMLALWVTAALVILQEVGVEVGPIMASAGVAGLAVGFGAQNLVRDVISGFFIILENQIRVGDVAVINDIGGLVEKINFRTTVLRDSAGTVHIFPNGAITKLANMTNEWSAYVFNLRVAYHEDTDKVVSVIREVGRCMREDEKYKKMMLGDPEIFGIDTLADSAVVIQGRLKTRPIQQWDVGREFLRRIKLAFEANDIEIPFPQQALHVKGDGDLLALLSQQGANQSRKTAGIFSQRKGSEEKPHSTPAKAAGPAEVAPKPQAETDTEFSEKEVREVERKTANKQQPPGASP